MKLKSLGTIVLISLLTVGCCTHSLDNLPPSPLDQLSDEIKKPPVIDSFYLTECRWPKTVHIETLQDSAWQMQEVMSTHKDCYVRHNGLVEVLKNGN